MSWDIYPEGAIFTVGHRDKEGVILARARAEVDMQWFARECGVEYWTDTNADYVYRAEVPIDVYEQFVVARARDTLKYDSLKKAAQAVHGSARYNLLSRVWSVLMTLQPYGVGVYNRPLGSTAAWAPAQPSKSKKQRRRERKAQRRRAEVEGPAEEYRCISCNGDVRNCPCYAYLDDEIERHLAQNPPF